MVDGRQIERVLVVTAHPDDVDFGAAGTVAGWTEQGIEVTYCICTDGAAGGFDDAVTRDQIALVRQREQEAAAKQVGVHDVRFLGYPDGRLTATLELRRDISRVIRQVRPQRVVTHSPEHNWRRLPVSHPDHRAAGEAAIAAVYPDARNPFAHPELQSVEGLAAWSVDEIWLIGHPEDDHYEDVTATFDAKLAAVRAHESQLPDPSDFEERMRGWLGANAAAAGWGPDRLAERFFVVPAT